MALPLGAYRRLFTTYLRPYHGLVGLLVGSVVASVGLQLAFPQIVRWFLDTATDGGSIRRLSMIATAAIIVALLTQVVALAVVWLSESVAWSAANDLRTDAVAHCLRLDLPFHQQYPPGALLERTDGDITAVAQFFSTFVVQVVSGLLLLAGVLVLVVWQQPVAGIGLTLFVSAVLYLMLRLRSFAVPALADEREATAGMFGFMEERIAGLDEIRANGAGAHVIRGLRATMRRYYTTAQKARRRNMAVYSLINWLFAATQVLALAFGIWFFERGTMTLGAVFLLYQYTSMVRRPLESMSEMLREVQRAGAGLVRVSELFSLWPAIRDGEGTALPPGPPEVRFDGVTFAYVPGHPALRDVSFTVPAGTTLGVLGRTGSGKSTLARLLLRLYEVEAGAVRLDGVDVRTLTLPALRARIGMVTQEVQLFRASLRDNLTLFSEGIPDARLVAVLEDLGLGDWLAALPDGLDTDIGAGGVSAGEAQLLAFARVFLRDPEVVILDEAASRLDPATERRIEHAVERLLAGRTAIVIAHRLRTLDRADHVLVLEQGRVREHGPRAALAADPRSRYAELLRLGEEVTA